MWWLVRLLLKIILTLVLLSVLWVGSYRLIDPPATYLMLRDRFQGLDVKRQWLPLEAMAVHLPRAVIAAEDSRFCSHHGLDFQAIEQAMADNRRQKRMRGGSTISQQTAKNAFLWPGRTLWRKGAEAWFTLLSEQLLGKRRILEIYLNIIEFGPGIYGAEAASQHYFQKSATTLSPQETARLAAILPQPLKRDAARPGPYTGRYAGQIRARMRIVERDALDACIRPKT